MSTEIATRQVLVPHTGEVVDLAILPPHDLAVLLDGLKEHKSRIREFEGEVSDLVVAEMDRRRVWTIDCGELKLVAKSDAPEVDYDGDALALVLTELVDNGTISPEAMDAACEQVQTWKVKKAGVNALRKNPRLAEAIDGCATETVPEGRRVRVTRK